MEIIKRDYCAICNTMLDNSIYNIANIPIQITCIDDNKNMKYTDFYFSQCSECNTIQLKTLIPLEILYEKSHNYHSIGKTWEGYYTTFIDIIKPLIEDKTILEIGCPSGKIANSINNYKKWYIVEPNKNIDVIFKDNIEFIECFFTNEFKLDKNIDIIIHSHFFEHTYEPNQFLKKCYELLKEADEMIFGVPNIQHLTEEKIVLFNGLCFEHTIFLNKQNICYLLKKNGFEIINIIDYVNHSNIYHVKKSIITECPIIKINDYYPVFMEIINDYTTFISKCNDILINTCKKVYIFGAGYNTQNLLSLGIKKDKIYGILDNCKEKQNKYLYGFDYLIYSPEIIKNTECIVILKNGYYINEIALLIRRY